MKEYTLDHSQLASSYHTGMIAGLSLIAQNLKQCMSRKELVCISSFLHMQVLSLLQRALYFIFTNARMWFPRGFQVGLSQYRNAIWHNLKGNDLFSVGVEPSTVCSCTCT